MSSENYHDRVSPDKATTWEKALETLTAMSVNQRAGYHPVSPKTFISNLRLYANEMEKLLAPRPRRKFRLRDTSPMHVAIAAHNRRLEKDNAPYRVDAGGMRCVKCHAEYTKGHNCEPVPDCPQCGGQRELGAVRGTYDCYFCGLKGSSQ